MLPPPKGEREGLEGRKGTARGGEGQWSERESGGRE